MRAKLVMAVVLALVCAACSPIYTSFDYDQQVRFENYRTFGWFPRSDSVSTDLSPLEERRLLNVIEDELKEKGMTYSEDSPDLLVTYHTFTKDVTEIQSTGDGYTAVSNTRAQTYTDGTFMLDLIDANTEKLVWRGIAEGTGDENPSPQQVSENIEKAVKKLLGEYPPG